jgi:hypothetical protein
MYKTLKITIEILRKTPDTIKMFTKFYKSRLINFAEAATDNIIWACRTILLASEVIPYDFFIAANHSGT